MRRDPPRWTHRHPPRPSCQRIVSPGRRASTYVSVLSFISYLILLVDAGIYRLAALQKKPDRSKSSDARRARSDVDKDSGDVLKAIDQSRSSSSASSLQSTR